MSVSEYQSIQAKVTVDLSPIKNSKLGNVKLFGSKQHQFGDSLAMNTDHQINSNFTTRAEFLADIPIDGKGIEIGPFANPLLHGPNVKYLDVLPTEQLIARARELGMDHTKVPQITYISDINGFPDISERFDYALSCHSIEHQPDLIKHLNQVEQILVPGGLYFLIIPDKRYCFDHYLSESTIADVVGAFLEKRTVHSAKSVIEHRALTTHNDPSAHFSGSHGDISNNQNLRVQQAISEFKNANGSYIDVHAWQFVPTSFTELVSNLNALNLVDLKITNIWNTPINNFEFYVTMSKTPNTSSELPKEL